MGWYAKFLTKYPYVFIVIDIILSVVCGPVTLWYYGLPDISDPNKGFEPRGTEIRKWSQAVYFAYRETEAGNLLEFPYKSSESHKETRQKRHATLDTGNTCISNVNAFDDPQHTPRLVVEHDNKSTLFTASNLHDICTLADKYIHKYWPQRNCDVVSLGHIIADLRNTSCNALIDKDVTETLEIVQKCSTLYFQGTLTNNCYYADECFSVPEICKEHNAVFNIIHALTDSNFMKNGNESMTYLEYSLIYIPWTMCSVASLKDWFLSHVDGQSIQYNNIQVKAMNIEIPNEIFNVYVMGDLPYFALAMTLVILILTFYLKSFVLMITVLLNVIFTICISYFLYFFVCRITFFPFMNLVAILLLIAVGADDVFILYDLWRLEKEVNPDAPLEYIMSETLRHGITSILVTSLTTAGALLANLISHITTLRCFGIFASLCMVVTFVLMITWVPAIIIILEKTSSCCSCQKLLGSFEKCTQKTSRASTQFWSKFMTAVVTKASPLWISLFFGLGAGGFYAVFVKPGLSLPSSKEFSLFIPSHPFEKYTKTYKEHFRFEDNLNNQDDAGMAVRVLWGMEGVDNGNKLNPDSLGHLVYNSFNLYQEESQTWMLSFCKNLLNQSFTSSIMKNNLCYMELFKIVVEGPCVYGLNFERFNDTSNDTYIDYSYVDVSPCCNHTFPLNETHAEQCMQQFAELSLGKYETFIAKFTKQEKIIIGKPAFQREKMKIYSSLFYTKQPWTAEYTVMDELYNNIKEFIQESMSTAPNGLKNGWFAGSFDFYDLQSTVATGTISGIGMCLAVAFIVLLITSLNILITIYAIITITLIIAITVGLLVLLGWELGLFESVTMTLAIGISVDFTIHYGIAYKLSKACTRRGRVKHAMTSVGSAVTMAALTTFMTGVAMIPGRVLTYRQFAIFLMVIMAFSWLLSTFFFMALCSILGPIGYQGNLSRYVRSCKYNQDKTVS